MSQADAFTAMVREEALQDGEVVGAFSITNGVTMIGSGVRDKSPHSGAVAALWGRQSAWQTGCTLVLARLRAL